MAASFHWGESNGAGQTISSGIIDINWKNADDTVDTAYSAAPITAGANSYEKWQFGKFYGTFNQISNGFYDHTAGAFGTGVTLYGAPTMTQDSDKLAYATPAIATNAALTRDYSTANGSFPSGAAVVYFSGTSPTATKATSSTSNPTFTNYLTTQLRTTGAAGAGDTASITLTLRYDEN
jgi:hypothetical protein